MSLPNYENLEKYKMLYILTHPTDLILLTLLLSVIEGTAPAIILQTFDSPNLSLLCVQYPALPDCLIEQNAFFVWFLAFLDEILDFLT